MATKLGQVLSNNSNNNNNNNNNNMVTLGTSAVLERNTLTSVYKIPLWLQKSCASAEDECLHFKSLYERSQEEMKDLAEKHKEVRFYM